MARTLLTAPPNPSPVPRVDEPLALTLRAPIWIVHRTGRRADEGLVPEAVDADTRARLEENGYRWNGTLARWWKYL